MKINYPALSPASYKALLTFENALAPSIFDRNLFDLLRIRVSQMNGCLFCVDMHIKEAKLHEEKQIRIHHLALWRESPLFSEKEKAALGWAESLTLIAEAHTTEESLELLKKHFSEKEISDLTFSIGAINLWNRFGVAFLPTPGSMDKIMHLEDVDLN
jgi:AhpD family alkylhydroperoxidase